MHRILHRFDFPARLRRVLRAGHRRFLRDDAFSRAPVRHPRRQDAVCVHGGACLRSARRGVHIYADHLFPAGAFFHASPRRVSSRISARLRVLRRLPVRRGCRPARGARRENARSRPFARAASLPSVRARAGTRGLLLRRMLLWTRGALAARRGVSREHRVGRARPPAFRLFPRS